MVNCIDLRSFHALLVVGAVILQWSH